MAVAPLTRTDYTVAPLLHRHIQRLCLDDALVCGRWKLVFIQPRNKYDRLKRFHAYYVLLLDNRPVGKLQWRADALRDSHLLLADVCCEVGFDSTARLVADGAWRMSHDLEYYRRVPVLK